MSFGRRNLQFAAFCASLAAFAAAGCGNGALTTEQRLKDALDKQGLEKVAVYPLAGHVTVDGQPPKFDKPNKLVCIVLFDPKVKDLQPWERPYVVADPETGEFNFHSFTADDGVPPGEYVLVFGEFTRRGKLGLQGPDLLGNHYNDPEKNEKIPEFKINHQAPGKKDYSFDLKVAGKEPEKENERSVTKLSEDEPKRKRKAGKS